MHAKVPTYLFVLFHLFYLDTPGQARCLSRPISRNIYVRGLITRYGAQRVLLGGNILDSKEGCLLYILFPYIGESILKSAVIEDKK